MHEFSFVLFFLLTVCKVFHSVDTMLTFFWEWFTVIQLFYLKQKNIYLSIEYLEQEIISLCDLFSNLIVKLFFYGCRYLIFGMMSFKTSRPNKNNTIMTVIVMLICKNIIPTIFFFHLHHDINDSHVSVLVSQIF